MAWHLGIHPGGDGPPFSGRWRRRRGGTRRQAAARHFAGCATDRGISNDFGLISLVDSVVRHNTGGGVINGPASAMMLTDSVVHGNSADKGAGIWNGGWMVLRGSVIRRNAAGMWGGGILNTGPDARLKLWASVVRRNTAGLGAGGVMNHGGHVSMGGGSSVTDNTPDDCHGTSAC